MTRSHLLGSLRGMLETASDDELRVFHVIASRVMGGGRKQYGPLHLANDARNFRKEGADEVADLFWYLGAQIVLDGYPATSSASPNELAHAEGVAPFSSPSLGALSPSPSSSADSHGDTFSRQGGGTVDAPLVNAVTSCSGIAGSNPAPDTTNRLGRACTDCGAGDGERHDSACPWLVVVPGGES